MNKQELLAQLNNAQNNFMLGIAALGLLMQKECYPILEGLICILTETSVSFMSDISQINSQFQDAKFPVKVSPFPLIEAANYMRTADQKQYQSIGEQFLECY